MVRKVRPFTLVALTVFHFTIASLLPIYNKELFIRYPFPLYATYLQMFFSVLPSFIIAWAVLGFPLSIRWAIPPIQVVPRLIIHGFLYGGMMLTGNLGFYVSDIDFAVLFRLSTIASSSLCGLLFLKERVSLWSSLAILLVLMGLIALTSNFQWSTAKMPTTGQLVVQLSAVFTSSLSSLFLKLTIAVLNNTADGHQPFTLLFWRYLFGCIPVLIASLLIEPNIMIDFDMIDLKFLLWTFLGVLTSGIFQVLNVVLHDLTTLVTLTIVSQMKFLPTLIISHMMYRATKWTLQQIFGAFTLVIGALLYSLSRLDWKKEKEALTEITDFTDTNTDTNTIEITVEDTDSADKEDI